LIYFHVLNLPQYVCFIIIIRKSKCYPYLVGTQEFVVLQACIISIYLNLKPMAYIWWPDAIININFCSNEIQLFVVKDCNILIAIEELFIFRGCYILFWPLSYSSGHHMHMNVQNLFGWPFSIQLYWHGLNSIYSLWL